MSIVVTHMHSITTVSPSNKRDHMLSMKCAQPTITDL